MCIIAMAQVVNYYYFINKCLPYYQHNINYFCNLYTLYVFSVIYDGPRIYCTKSEADLYFLLQFVQNLNVNYINFDRNLYYHLNTSS
jgi:hypothetical protein